MFFNYITVNCCTRTKTPWVTWFESGWYIISCVVCSGQSEGAGPASVSGWVHCLLRTQKIPSSCFPVRGSHPLQQDQKDWRRIWHLHLQTVIQGTECDVNFCFVHRVSCVSCEVELLYPFRQPRSEWQRTSATAGCALRSGFAGENPRIRSSYRPVLERWRLCGPASSERSCGGRPYETEVKKSGF